MGILDVWNVDIGGHTGSTVGGLGVCVRNLESLDDDIEKVKYLKKIGQLERQKYFFMWWSSWL